MKNNRVILILVFLFFVANIFAQNKVDRFCKINVNPVRKHGQYSLEISIDYGQKESFSILNDTTLIHNLEKVRSFTNDIDALNYMSSIGWSLINISYYVRRTEFEVYYTLYFKKEFEKQ